MLDDIFGKPDALPRLKKLELPDVSEGIAEWSTQFNPETLKKLTGGVDTLNADVQRRIKGTYGNFDTDWAKAQETTSSFLRGEIPADVASSISRSAAARSMGGGFGFGSGMGRNLEARDLGLTSLDLLTTGFNRMGSQLGTARNLNPYDVGGFAFTPQQLLARQDQETMTNLGITHQNQAIDFQNSQRRSWFDTLLTDTLKSTIETPFKLVQNSNTMVQQAPQMAMSMCGQAGAPAAAPAAAMPASTFTPSFGIQPTQNMTFPFQSATIPAAPRF